MNNQGTPPGKATLWVLDESRIILTGGYILYNSLSDALLDMPKKLLEFKGVECVVNYKTSDSEHLEVWVLRREMNLPRQKPFDWSKLWPFGRK